MNEEHFISTIFSFHLKQLATNWYNRAPSFLNVNAVFFHCPTDYRRYLDVDFLSGENKISFHWIVRVRLQFYLISEIRITRQFSSNILRTNSEWQSNQCACGFINRIDRSSTPHFPELTTSIAEKTLDVDRLCLLLFYLLLLHTVRSLVRSVIHFWQIWLNDSLKRKTLNVNGNALICKSS